MMRAMTTRHLLAAFLLCLLASAARSAPEAPPSGDARRLIVAFRPGTSPEERRLALEKAGLSIDEDMAEIGAVIAEAPRFSPSAVPALKAEPAVAEVVEDYYRIWLYEAPELPTMQDFRERLLEAPKPAPVASPRLENGEFPWGIERVNARDAWPRTTGAGVKVAVLDTGIDPDHPELAGKVAGGTNGALFGGDWRDDNGHGTHVSGTIAAQLDGRGVVGVAPGVQLYAVKVLDKNGGGNLTSILKGFYWCVRNRMQVVNMSLGSPNGIFVWHWLIEYAHSRGVVLVAAAGNSSGAVGYPAAYPEVIAVSASDVDDRLAPFSSRGPQVAFIAPGVDVMSSIPGGGYARHSGTSMATPHVTGLAALAIALGHSGPEDVRRALTAAARPLPGLSRSEQGAGMIDAGKLAGRP